MITRCTWVGTDPLFIEYHDQEWGVPVHDDQKIYEFLVLESAQAGLSWATILKRREGYRKAFASFDPVKVAKFTEKKVQALMKDASIIRNEMKIRSAINNAQKFLEIQKEFGSFDKYIWSFVGGKPVNNKRTKTGQIPATTKISDALAKDMKKRGFRFLGTTILYAHMQATGMVNDHLVSCICYKGPLKVKKLKASKKK